MMDAAASERFVRICKRITARGSGITRDELADAGALARELDRHAPDEERVEALAARLEVDVEELDFFQGVGRANRRVARFPSLRLRDPPPPARG